MNIWDKLDSEFLNFRREARRAGGPGERTFEEIVEDFAASIQKRFDSLTPDERVEIFELIVEDTDDMLEDQRVEMNPAETIRLMMLQQIFRQLIPRE